MGHPPQDHLCDTNILLRLGEQSSPEHLVVFKAVRTLLEQGSVLFFTSQNIAELWNVCTRLRDHNGQGLSIAETRLRVELIEDTMHLLLDSFAQHKIWLDLVYNYSVRGVQVHDARLVAAMKAHGVQRILTLNGKDFKRYDGITAVHPSEI